MSASQADRRRRLWYKADSRFFGSQVEQDIYQRWGADGDIVWLAYEGACKRAYPTEGRVPYTSEAQLAAFLGITDREFHDRLGKPFALDEFFVWTGIAKLTKLHRRGEFPHIEHRRWQESQHDRDQSLQHRSRHRSKTAGQRGRAKAEEGESQHDRDQSLQHRAETAGQGSKMRRQDTISSSSLEEEEEVARDAGAAPDGAVAARSGDPDPTPVGVSIPAPARAKLVQDGLLLPKPEADR